MLLKRSLTPLFIASLVLGPACHCGSSAIRSQAPQIVVVPAAIVITPVPLKHTATVQVQVKNAGNSDLHLAKDPELSESDADGIVEYTLASPLSKDCQGNPRVASSRLTLATGECALVTLAYAPANVDKDPGELRFTSDDPDHGTLVVPISLGAPATLKICTLKADGSVDACDATDGTPPTLDFGITARSAVAKKKLRLQNVGTVRIDLSGIQPPAGPNGPNFALDASPAAPTYLDPGKSADLTVSFTPSASGQRTGFLEIDSTDSTRDPIKVPLAGRADGPALCASPSPVDFGSAGVGQKVDKTVMLTNCGTVDVNLQAVNLDTFSSPSFVNVGSLPGAQKLAVGASVTVNLRWVPDETGDASGQLNIPNDGDPAQAVNLHGLGIATCLSPSVRSLDFGQVAKGQFADRPLTVANNGTHPCTLNHVAISAGSSYFSVTGAPTAPVVLRPGDTFPVTVRYSVPATDTNSVDTGTVTFQSDDTVNPTLDVALIGHPVASPECKLQIVPAIGGIPPFTGRTLVFGNVVVGHDKSLAVTLKNVGSAACSISGYKFVTLFGIPLPGTSCAAHDCDDFHVIAPTPSGTLQPGQTTSINIKFSPTNTNQLPIGPTDFLQVQTSDQNFAASAECVFGLPPNSNAGCVQVGMSGQGDISNLEVIPSDLDFGLTTLGCKTLTQTVTLYNTGTTATIHIKGFTLNPASAPFYVVAPPATPSAPLALAPGGVIKIQVTYRPSAAQRETAQLLIENDASNTTSNNPYVTVGLAGTGTTDKHQVDTFTQSAVPKVDMLFAIDDSGSFDYYQNQLSQQASKFVQAALKANADYHIGVCSNDVVDQATGSGASYPGTIYVGGLYGQPAIVTNATPDPAGAFSKNVKLGTGGTAQREAGLELARDVLSAPANQKAAPQGSKGFLRDDARLVVIDVQDDDDESNGSTAYYIDFFKSLKGQYNAGLVSFNAIGAFDDSGNPHQCIPNDSESGGDRYYAVAQGTGGKTWSLCTADWGAIADQLALGAFQGRKQFSLTRVADPVTIVVTLNGAAQTAPANYTYDQPSNSIIFTVVPAPGAVVVVNYDAICFP